MALLKRNILKVKFQRSETKIIWRELVKKLKTIISD